jgi:hypothetical protein
VDFWTRDIFGEYFSVKNGSFKRSQENCEEVDQNLCAKWRSHGASRSCAVFQKAIGLCADRWRTAHQKTDDHSTDVCAYSHLFLPTMILAMSSFMLISLIELHNTFLSSFPNQSVRLADIANCSSFAKGSDTVLLMHKTAPFSERFADTRKRASRWVTKCR